MRWRVLMVLVPVMILITTLTLIIFKINEDRLMKSLGVQESERIEDFLDELVEEYQYIRGMLTYISEQKSTQELFVYYNASDTSQFKQALSTRLAKLIDSQSDFNGLSIVDISGRTLLNIEKFGQKVIISEGADNANLANKKAFQSAIKLNEGQVLASSMQLETVDGEVAKPIEPVIDFFTPVYDSSGNRQGVVKLTYDASAILRLLEKIEARSGASILMTNATGHFLKARKQANEWGFQLQGGGNKTLKSIHKELWQALQDWRSPQFKIGDRLFTAVRICDKELCNNQSEILTAQLKVIAQDMPWTLVSELNLKEALSNNQASARWYLVYGMIAVLGAIALLSSIGAWRLIKTNESLEQAKKEVSGKDKLFKTFIHGNPSLVYAKDSKGKYVIANDAYATFLNETSENLVGKSDFDLKDVNVEQISQHITQEQLVFHSGKVTVADESWLSQENRKTNFVVTRFPVDIDGDNESDMVGVIAVDVTERDMARSEMAQKEAMFRALVNSSPNAIVIIDENGQINFANNETSHILGWSQHDLIGVSFEQIIPGDIKQRLRDIHKTFAKEQGKETPKSEHQLKAMTKHGGQIDVEVTFSPIKLHDATMTMVILRDVTSKLRMEAHMRQSQKMEAIGHLTGGVAHDFNNLLGVIIGNLDLLSSMHPDDDKVQKRLNGALKAALSGAELTKRLLAFARKQTLNPQVIDIGASLEEMVPILDRTLKGDVELKVNIPEGLSKVFIDNGEFENVILNMAINARDAMPAGGVLTIEGQEVDLDQDFIASNDGEISPGRYIHISLSDTGSGMPAEIIRHIFEPFYTTKEKGKGTGLGLAMAHGFVNQSKGLLKVYSEQGIGTTFHIYLPLADSAEQHNAESQFISVEEPEGGDETIMIVDDETDLAEIASAHLQTLGYQTLIVHSGEAALETLAANSEVALVLTDIIMPGGMDGVELHRQIHERFPQVKVVYASGFSADALTNKRGHEINADLVQKPYRKQNLALIVRKNLDAGLTQKGGMV